MSLPSRPLHLTLRRKIATNLQLITAYPPPAPFLLPPANFLSSLRIAPQRGSKQWARKCAGLGAGQKYEWPICGSPWDGEHRQPRAEYAARTIWTRPKPRYLSDFIAASPCWQGHCCWWQMILHVFATFLLDQGGGWYQQNLHLSQQATSPSTCWI